MIDALIATGERNLDYACRLVADVPQEKMCLQPIAGQKMNHATWVLGHLARVTDTTASFFGLEPVSPPEWNDMFGMKSLPCEAGTKCPDKATLLAVLERGHARVTDALRKAGPSVFSQPTPIERLRGRFPTTGQAMIHLMVNHEATHLGQLSAWRRAQGMPGV